MKNKVYYVLKDRNGYMNNERKYNEVTSARFYHSKSVAEFINENDYEGKYKIKKITIIEEVSDAEKNI